MTDYKQEQERIEGLERLSEKAVEKAGGFLKRAFEEMKDSAKAQHEVDKANFKAVKAESKAQFEEARAMRDPVKRKAMLQAQREEQIAAAKERADAAQVRINAIKK